VLVKPLRHTLGLYAALGGEWAVIIGLQADGRLGLGMTPEDQLHLAPLLEFM
jgi:hypothetical protein